tara:strand:+ start:627 stop:893 length:267 start_codon:yes stop_codon:yes gene_type:complete
MEFKELQSETINTQLKESIESSTSYINLEFEIPEVLYKGMREFLGGHPDIDQYVVLSSALANFLYQNGCSDRAVIERYLNDLFNLSKA